MVEKVTQSTAAGSFSKHVRVSPSEVENVHMSIQGKTSLLEVVEVYLRREAGYTRRQDQASLEVGESV